MMRGFSVYERDQGHWDISDGRKREWCIRGEPGDVIVCDEREDPSRPHPRPVIRFKSVSAALLWIADHYMTDHGSN